MIRILKLLFFNTDKAQGKGIQIICILASDFLWQSLNTLLVFKYGIY